MKTVNKTLSIAVLTAAFVCGPALVSSPTFDLGNANAAQNSEMAAKYKQEMFKQAHAFKMQAEKHMQASKELHLKAEKMNHEAQKLRQALAHERDDMHKAMQESNKLMVEGKKTKNAAMVKKAEELKRKVEGHMVELDRKQQQIGQMVHDARQLEMKANSEHKQARVLMENAHHALNGLPH